MKSIAAALLLSAFASAAGAQTLGELAVQEAARRRDVTTPARVFTARDVRPVMPPVVLPDAPAPVTLSPASARRVPVKPAEFRSGALPAIAVQALAAGEVQLELSVGADGRVTGVTVLRHTPPFTANFVDAVRAWQFQSAEDADEPLPGQALDSTTQRPVASKVLVIGLIRPPALYQGTLGQPPVTVATSSAAVPAVTAVPMPLFPAGTLFDGAVLSEVGVGADGRVESRKVLRSSPGFDGPALEALGGLAFTPAQVHGRGARTLAYVVSLFRQPITP